MSIQIDETKSDNHIKMRNKLEYFEMWSRMADNLKFEYLDENIIF